MAKFTYDDKLRIQTLREQGLGAKRIVAAYPDRQWNLNTVKTICKRIDRTGSATRRKPGSGRPKTVRNATNIAAVNELICSQDDHPGTSQSTRQIAQQLKMSRTSVRRIAKVDLHLQAFKRMPVQVLNTATKTKRLTRCSNLLLRVKSNACKKIFFTDEKMFYLDPPINSQNDRVWAEGRKRNVASQRLLHQRAKFSRSVMVSAGVSFSGKGRLHFVPEKVKVNTDCYLSNLLPGLLEDCRDHLGNDFIFQQDGAPAHAAKQTQDFLQRHCPSFINKDEWPPNSPDLNPLDYYVWGAMLERYNSLSRKPTDTEELKEALLNIWNELPQTSIQKAIRKFPQRLQSCIRAEGGHFEHLLQ